MGMKYRGEGAFEVAMESFETLQLTPERIRDLGLNHKVTSGPGLDIEYMPTWKEVTNIGEMVYEAVTKGQVLAFGYWPNDMIRSVAKRSGLLYTQSALAHPFRSPYIILHSWDDVKSPWHDRLISAKKGLATNAYLVNPFAQSSDGICIDFEALEFEGITVDGKPHLSIGDRVLFHAEESMKHKGYVVEVVPFMRRFDHETDPRFVEAMKSIKDVDSAAAANVLDPVMVALAILNTKNVRSETITAPDKLAKARARSGKPVIPPYRKIHSEPYVTAIMSRQERTARIDHGGTHASPAPHIRRGHIRHYSSGERTFIADTLVNSTEQMRKTFKSNRSHYDIKGN